MITIRQATVGDVPALLPLVSAYWSFERITGFDSERVAASLTHLLSEPRLGVGWIATTDHVPVGYLLAVYVFSLEHQGLTAEIDELFVSPSRRGQNVGAQLLKVAEAEFAKVGCTNVSLQLARGNTAASRFYRRHAYSERSGYELLEKTLHVNRPETDKESPR